MMVTVEVLPSPVHAVNYPWVFMLAVWGVGANCNAIAKKFHKTQLLYFSDRKFDSHTLFASNAQKVSYTFAYIIVFVMCHRKYINGWMFD